MFVVLISVLPMLTFASVLLLELANTERQTLEARIQDTSRSLSMIVDQEIGQSQAIITALSTSHYLDENNLAEFYAQARRVVPGDDRWIILFNRNRDQLLNTLQPFGAKLPKGVYAPAVETVFATRKPVVSDLLPYGSVADRPVVGMAVPVIRDDQVVYVLALTLSTDSLRRVIAAQTLPNGWRAGILDRYARLIARSHASDQFIGTFVGALEEKIANEEQGVMLTNNLEGQPAYAAFKRSDLTGWSTVVTAPRAALAEPLDRSLTLLVTGGGGLLLIALAIAGRSARQIAEPVRRLTHAATTLGQGGIPDAALTYIPEINEVGNALVDAAVELRERQARLRAALDIVAMGIWRWDVRNQVVEWDAATSGIHGFERTAATYEQFHFLRFVYADDRERIAAEVRGWRQNPSDLEAEYRIVRPDGALRWIYKKGEMHVTADGQPDYVIGAIVDITERKFAEEALAEAHSRSSEIVESITDAFYALDAENRLIYANHKALEWWNKSATDIIGQRLLDVFPHIGRWEAWPALQEVARERRPLQLETISASHRDRWIGLSIYPTAGGGLTVFFRDITSRKDSERRQELLIGELNHRVKNTLAAVQSIVAQGLRGANDPQAFAQALQGRLMALSGAHDLLTRTAWEGADLSEVIRAALAPFESGNRLSIQGPPIHLQPNAAVALSMAFHELATNAAKYGALSNANGRVNVTWTLDAPATTAIILWRETGGPPVSPPERRGFGSRLIERGLAYELDGEVTLSFLPDGVECQIRLPLPNKTETAQ